MQGVCNGSLKISWARCLQQQSWDQLSKAFATAVLRSVEQGVCSSSLKISHPRCLQTARCLSTKCPVGPTRVLVYISFIFSRFLLICQLEGLNLTFTLKWFFSLKYFRTLSQKQSENRGFRVFLRVARHKRFLCFYFWFWADVFGRFRLYIQPAVQSKYFVNIERSFPKFIYKIDFIWFWKRCFSQF